MMRWSGTWRVAAVLLITSGAASAQSGQTATLTGSVTDTSGAVLPGVSVTAASPHHIGGPQGATTDVRGQYRLTGLTPGSYDLTVSLSGFNTVQRANVRLTPGFIATVDFTLVVADVTQTVVVGAASPTVDVRSSALPTVLGVELLENLPTGKDIADLLNLVPGVANNAAFGAARWANVVTLDGVSGNEPGWGTPFVVPNLNWMEQIQVVSLGATAEHGEFTGARLNALVRSGSNRFSGLGEYWTTRPGWVGNNRGTLSPTLAARFKPLQILERWDASAQMGGPIKQDRLWFFAGLERVERRERWASFADMPRTPDEPVYSRQQSKALLKLTAVTTPSIRLQGFYEHDNSTTTGLFASPLTRPEALGRGTNPQRVWNVHASWTVSAATFVEARHAGHKSGYATDPVPPGTREGPPPRWDAGTNVYSSNAIQYDYGRYRPLTFAANVTHYLTGMLGRSHDFKAGVEYENSTLSSGLGYPGGQLYADFFGVPTQVYFWDGAVYRPRQTRNTFYVQDAWQMNSRLTLNPGLRVGNNRGQVPTHGHALTTRTISPRIGVAWDVDAQHRTVVRAHYGRYHDAFVTSFYDFLDPLSQSTFIVANVVGPDQFQELSRSDASRRSSIDPRLRHSYAAETLVGVERELFAEWSLKAQYVRHDFEDTIAFTDPTSIYEAVSRIDPGRDGRVGTADDAGSFTVYNSVDPSRASLVLTNPSEAFRYYQALQVIGTKRYSHNWQMQASYTWSRTYGNLHNTIFSNAANNAAGPGGTFSNPNRAINATSRTPNDVPHELKAFGTYRAPWLGGFNVSAVYRYFSGRPYGRLVPAAGLRQGFQQIRVEPIGTHRAAAVNTVDVRVEKTIPFGRGRRVGLYADVLNAGNHGVPLAVNEQSGVNYGLPGGWLEPRSLRVALRVSF